MAHTKAKGTSKLGRDSQSQRLGVKVFGASPIKSGMIIIRQRGSKYYAGTGVGRGKDDTLFAKTPGKVLFQKKMLRRFTGHHRKTTVVSVVS